MSAQPCGRFEWERIVRRLVVPERVKLTALLLATFADSDGTRVRPGQRGLIDMIGRSKATVKRTLAVLRDDLGIVEEVSRGGGGFASEYQLVIPDDLLERVEILGPGGGRASQEAGSGARNRPTTGLTVLSPVMAAAPVDNSVTGLTLDEPSSTGLLSHMGSYSAVFDRTGLISEATGLTQAEPPPILTPATKEDHTKSDPARPPQREGTPKCIHRMSSARHADGTPVCVLCRRIAQEVS